MLKSMRAAHIRQNVVIPIKTHRAAWAPAFPGWTSPNFPSDSTSNSNADRPTHPVIN